MTRLGFLLVLTIAVLMVRQGETLGATMECWTCHSSAPGEEGCTDPFHGYYKRDSNRFVKECGKEYQTHLQFLPNETEHRYTLHPGFKFVCYKMTFTSLGIRKVMRGCGSRSHDIPEGSCMDSDPGKTLEENIEIETCDVCVTDACNDGNVIIEPNLSVVILLILSIVHNL